MAANITFDDLPPELILMVFKNLPLASLKEARLVSQSWSDFAAEGVFRTCKINLVKKPGKVLSTITGRTRAFLNSVRHLTVDFEPIVWHKRISNNSFEGARLGRLLGALVKHTLLSFSCAYLIELEVIYFLLRTQHRLRDLVTAISPQLIRRGLPLWEEARGGLSNIRKFGLTIDSDGPGEYYDIESWFAHMPLLKSFAYSVIAHPAAAPLNDWTFQSRTLLLNLRSLDLRGLIFSRTAATLATQLQLPSLRSLRIQECENCSILLTALTNAYVSDEVRHLETYIYTSMDRKDDIAALTFLQPLRKLKTIVLTLEANNDEDMPVPGIFLQQGDELQFLHIGSGLYSRVHYKANSLEALGRICPEVKVLCIELADIEGEMNDLEKTTDFVIPPRNEATDSLNMLKDILKALAGFKKLRTLRINNEPFGRSYSTNRRRYRHLQLASEIFKYLAKSESSIQLLVFCPNIDTDPAQTDAWGHTWPQYTYRMGSQHAVGDTISEVVAIPVTCEVARSIEPLHEYLWENWFEWYKR